MSKDPSSLRINKFLSRFAFLSSLIVGFIFIWWSYAHSNLELDDEISPTFKSTIHATGIIWISVGILIAIIKRARYERILLLLTTINFFYLFIEFVTYLTIISGFMPSREKILEGSLGVFNRSCAIYDSTSGYKWLPVPARVTKIVRNEVIFDTRFEPNNQGYISKQDFHYTKKDSTTTRYIVFGDSFTASEFLPQPWPDQVQHIVDSFGTDLELYSFAIDGGGLVNWYRTFFFEIVPKYEFDGVILAIWGDNLDRDFFIMHHTDSAVYSQYFTSVPKNIDDLKENFLPDMWWSTDVIPDEDIDAKLSEIETGSTFALQFVKPELNFLMKAYDVFHNIQYQNRKKDFEKQYIANKENKLADYTIDNVVEKYGSEKASRFETIMKYCANNDKHVILSSVPYLPGINYNKKGEFYSHQLELRFLANYYDADYFDGFEIYRDLSQQELAACFLKYDLHWSQKGSNIFAAAFTKFLIESQ